MAHHKLKLASKTCPNCLRLFNWRKKWKLNWDDVIYCSERCRRNKPASVSLINLSSE